MAKIDGVEQYKGVLTEYSQILRTLKQLEGQTKATEIRGISLEGKLTALEEAFGFKREEMVKEIGTEV